MLTAVQIAVESLGGLALAWGLLRQPVAARALAAALAEPPVPYVPQDFWGGLA